MNLFRKQKSKNTSNELLEGVNAALPGHLILEKEAAMSVKAIKNLMSVPSQIYEEVYLSLLSNVAAFCQSMPVREGAPAYSLLQEQLNLTIATLTLRRALLLPQGETVEKIALQEARWTFAFFSASLLYQLTRVQQDRQVILVNADGGHQKIWHPILGHLYPATTHYLVKWQALEILPQATLATALIKSLIPAQALQWMLNIPAIWLPWWQAMTEPNSTKGIILETLASATQQINYPLAPSSSLNVGSTSSSMTKTAPLEETLLADTLMQTEVAPVLDSQQVLIEFLTWLQAWESEPSLLKNDESSVFCLLFKTDEGLMVTHELLEEYLSHQTQFENRMEFIECIQNFLLKEQENWTFSFRSLAIENKQRAEGIVIHNDYLNDYFQFQPTYSLLIPAHLF